MKTLRLFLTLLACFSIVFVACKKDEDDDMNNNQNINNNSVLCNGISLTPSATVNKYLPLKVGYKWTYGSDDWEIVDVATDTSGDEVFEFAIDDGFFGTLTQKYKVKNGEVIRIFSSNGPFVYITANPQTGDSWPYQTPFEVGTRRVISTSATLTISGCTYTDVLQIKEADADGDEIATYYYVEGLGHVRKGQGFFGNEDLTAVVLD